MVPAWLQELGCCRWHPFRVWLGGVVHVGFCNSAGLIVIPFLRANLLAHPQAGLPAAAALAVAANRGYFCAPHLPPAFLFLLRSSFALCFTWDRPQNHFLLRPTQPDRASPSHRSVSPPESRILTSGLRFPSPWVRNCLRMLFFLSFFFLFFYILLALCCCPGNTLPPRFVVVRGVGCMAEAGQLALTSRPAASACPLSSLVPHFQGLHPAASCIPFLKVSGRAGGGTCLPSCKCPGSPPVPTPASTQPLFPLHLKEAVAAPLDRLHLARSFSPAVPYGCDVLLPARLPAN